MPIEKVSKHTSRIAAVQIMYQKDIINIEIGKILHNFINHYMLEAEEHKDINLRFFKRLVNHFADTSVDFEDIISKNLLNEKTFYSISIINKSILKVAIIEMIFEKTDIPVIITEYVEITKLFSDRASVKFVNAMLDKISKQIERKCLVNV